MGEDLCIKDDPDYILEDDTGKGEEILAVGTHSNNEHDENTFEGDQKPVTFSDDYERQKTSVGKGPEECSQKSGIIFCKECGKSYSSKQTLRRHLKIHTGHMNLCNICGKQYVHVYQVKKHMDSVHYGVRFQCDECETTFKTKGGLHQHKLMHKGQYQFVCYICARGFNYSTDYKNHMDRHSDVKRHQCKKCQKRFTVISNLRRHMLGCGKTVRAFECDLCGKAFKTRRYLTAHIKQLHENKDVAQCQVCGQVFQYRASLYRHKKKTGHE